MHNDLPPISITPDPTSVPTNQGAPLPKKFSEIFSKKDPLPPLSEEDKRLSVTDSIIQNVRKRNGDNLVSDQLFRELAEHYFPTEVLFEIDQSLLANPDWRAVNAALERVHKLKGNFTRKIDITVHGSDKVKQMTDAELRDIIEGEIVSQSADVDTPSLS